MRRRWLAVVGALVLVALAVWNVPGLLPRSAPPIRVGVLHSLSGPLEMSERSMMEAEVLALEEIKGSGGLLGRDVEWVVRDGASDPGTFEREARRLIEQDHVTVIFGGMTSACRTAMARVVERSNHLLIFPSNYEGLTVSQNVVCTGPLPNQQVIPAVNWCFETLEARKFFLVGSVDVMSYAINTIVRDQLQAIGGTTVGESYAELDGRGVTEMVAAIKASGADVVINSVEGAANRAFFHQLSEAGLPPSKLPVVSVTVSEDELRQLPANEMAGDYAAWGYFQSIGREENLDFVKRFQAKYGSDRPTSDSITSAYGGVMLWKQAVEEADSAETGRVRKALRRQSRNAPEGIVSIDYDTLHAWRPFYIGKIRPDGQFDVVLDLLKPIRPVPFPMFRTRSQWEETVKAWDEKGKAGSSSPSPAPPPAPPSPAAPPASRPSQASMAPRVWGDRGVVSAVAVDPPRAAAVDRPRVSRNRPTTR